MTDLERAVADSLRITEEAANVMLPTIQRNIGAAKAELVRDRSRSGQVGAEEARCGRSIMTAGDPEGSLVSTYRGTHV